MLTPEPTHPTERLGPYALAMTYPDPLLTARDLRSEILALRGATDSDRRVPEGLATHLGQAGFGRLLLPAEQPGHQLDPLAWLDVLEEFADAEAAVAWLAWNSALPCLVARHLTAEGRADVFADPAAMYANSTRPSGRAVRTDGGFMLSGRWSLVSGCELAAWMPLMALVWDPDSGRPEKTDAGPALRLCFLPSDQIEIIDTWHSGGLRGSGSHDVTVSDRFVPDHFVADLAAPNTMRDQPLGRMPWAALLAAGHASISLGIVRAVDRTFREEIAGAGSVDTGTTDKRTHPGLQATYADGVELVHAARSHLRSVTGRLWAQATAERAMTPLDIADLFAAARHAGQAAKVAAVQLFELAGTAALYESSPIERAMRDLQTVNQHVIVSTVVAEQVGRVRLGLDPTMPFFFPGDA